MKNQFQIYHDTYTSSIAEVISFVKNNNLLLDDLNFSYSGEQVDNKVSVSEKKPSIGQTTQIHFELFKEVVETVVGGDITTYKSQKKYLHVQVYNRGTENKTFELNMYLM